MKNEAYKSNWKALGYGNSVLNVLLSREHSVIGFNSTRRGEYKKGNVVVVHNSENNLVDIHVVIKKEFNNSPWKKAFKFNYSTELRAVGIPMTEEDRVALYTSEEGTTGCHWETNKAQEDFARKAIDIYVVEKAAALVRS